MLESRPWVLSTLNDLNKAIGPEGYKKEVTKKNCRRLQII